MQVQNIQRPSLYTDFFNLELMWNSEYLSYIQTTSNNVTSFLNITKKSIKKVKKTQSHNIMMSKSAIARMLGISVNGGVKIGSIKSC